MKKALIKNIVLWKKQDISLWNVKIKLKECSIVNKENKCVRDNVKLKINYISWKEANEWLVSTNRKALTKEWKIVTLQSWGMAYIDFIKKDWSILKLKKWEQITIVYNITIDDIKNMENKILWNWEKEWYWWYDKNKNIRRESAAQYYINKRNLTFSAKISNLY
jgi:hypothetical protein